MPGTQPRKYGKASRPYARRYGTTPKKALQRYRVRLPTSYSGRLLQALPVAGFPEDLTVRLRYNMFQPISTSNTTGQAVYQFKMNSVYDPDQTGTGHQPLYRDQLYLIYRYAVVTKCHFTINVSTTTISGVLINAQATTYLATDTDSSTAVERGQTNQAFIQLGKPAKLEGDVDMASLFGVLPQAILTDDLYRHANNADPSQLAYLTLYMQDTESAASRISMVVTLDMTVNFREVIQVTSS